VTAAGEERLVADALQDLFERLDPGCVDPATFLNAQFDAGLAWVYFEPGYGGLGVGPGHQTTVRRALDERGVMSTMRVNPVAYGQAGGAIHDFGTPEQRARWLRGDVVPAV
jgi:alkylation response protein AidB-like acyl-CoA dehydrogenase